MHTFVKKNDLSLNKLFALYFKLMQESPKVFCALYGAFQGSEFGFHKIRGPLMLSVGTLRDPQFSKKDDFLSFVCQMLPRMADHDTYLNVFFKNIIYRDTTVVGNHVFGIILSTKI